MSKTVYKIPQEVISVAKQLSEAGFSAYLVGGCVRDLLLVELGLSNIEGPKDWDLTTNAKPAEIQKIFPDSVYENQFGTVGVKIPTREAVGTPTASVGAEQKHKWDIIEITTFRIEGRYSDKRHPDEIKFAKTIEEDLSRRDFTVNALALSVVEGMAGEITDPHGGQQDLKNKLLRAVGEPEKRFQEDALRLVRAVRFASELGWKIESGTAEALKSNARLLQKIALERIRDEFAKIIMAPNAKKGIEALEEFGLLKYIMPELREGIEVGQNKHHIYNVWEHNLLALDYAAKKDFSLTLRLASLLHDVGKPRTKRGDGINSTFHGHEIVGARMARKMLEYLRFPKEVVEKVVHLVRYHLFYYNVGEVSEAGVRRFISRVGVEHIDDLIKLRQADRIGSGVPKAVTYKIRHLLFMIEKVRQDPVSPKMLKINGLRLMEILGIEPGPKVGWILAILLDEVLEDPGKNSEAYLEKKALEINQFNDDKLRQLFEKARETKQGFEAEQEGEIKQKYFVK
ncbi:MAG: hypothetical protein UW89_C0012G0008 [Parcubacteria group bacterium GW2011_GWB1_45_10]|nr:MAG: hypothetical protein UW89_C0012G0008 [Parcubacteria group bacterium GW2011_GWB1_45_10]